MVVKYSSVLHASSCIDSTQLHAEQHVAGPDHSLRLTPFLAQITEFLDSILRLLSRTRLPAITGFNVSVESCPSKQDVSSESLTGTQASGIGDITQKLWLIQGFPSSDDMYIPEDLGFVLGLEDLRSCMSFSTLRSRSRNGSPWTASITRHGMGVLELVTQIAIVWTSLD